MMINNQRTAGVVVEGALQNLGEAEAVRQALALRSRTCAAVSAQCSGIDVPVFGGMSGDQASTRWVTRQGILRIRYPPKSSCW
jgi:hypothetical protein